MLLGCLVMVITGHNIVPHHHHPGALNSHSGCGQQNVCGQQNAGEQQNAYEQHDARDHTPDHTCNTENPARHCHAFNGLEYLVALKNKVDKKTLTITGRIILISLIQTNEPLPREVFFSCSSGPPPEFKGFLGESSGLRAPPVIS